MISDRETLKQIPKIELHAHLFGSITQDQLLDLLDKNGLKEEYEEFNQIKDNLDFDKIFAKAFTYLPKIVKTIEDLKQLTRMVLDNFIKDNVVYIELRSGPKKFENSSHKEYIEAIISVFKEYEDKIIARYIVSINRGYGIEPYKDVVSLMNEVDPQKEYIVGMDFSGDATKNDFVMFVPLLEQARNSGFKITVHSPEKKYKIKELSDIINFKPDRIGHLLFFTDEQVKKIISEEIPIEICPTSNYVVGNKENRHFIDLKKKGLKEITICTDDLLLFDADLSEEWEIYMTHAEINIKDVFEMIVNSIKYMFDERVKEKVEQSVLEYISKSV